MNAPARADVVIVGAGPVGLTLANLLGTAGVSTVVLERNGGTVPEPRAIALDGESLRTLQAAGLAETVCGSLREGFVADYVNGAGQLLFSTDLNPRPYGFCLQNSFDQPELERQLLEGLKRFPCVEVFFNTELLSFIQNADAVDLKAGEAGKGSFGIRAQFLVGCDGGRSTVREQLQIRMLGDRLPQRWLVIDTIDNYLSGDPECRFFCDPLRPAMTMLRPRNERRWEWMLLEDEDDEHMLEDRVIRNLLAAHTDAGQVEIYRKVVYGFSAVVAERFAKGRVFLAGDAAHMTPPFAGQGLNAGIRDVRNLSWKLQGVVRGSFPESILLSYNFERHDAAQDLVNLAVALGDQIQPTDEQAAAKRDAFFAELNNKPGAGAQFGRDLMAPLHDVRLGAGWYADDGCGGRLLPQPRVSAGGQKQLLDDTLPDGFVALLPQGVVLPDDFPGHELWQRMAPAVVRLPDELRAFAGEDGIVVLRPDRFVLAKFSPRDALTVMDDLLHRLGYDGGGCT